MIDISYPEPMLITSPILFLVEATDRNPDTVSSTKQKSLVGLRDPNLIVWLPDNNWVIIVGMIALDDCLGPYVLKGLIVDTGNPNVL